MKNYKEQDGCHNCIFRREDSDWDSPTEYFCSHDQTMSSKDFYKPASKTSSKFYEKLREWREKHVVSAFGICDLYKKEETEQ